jgi:hypothetical protein
MQPAVIACIGAGIRFKTSFAPPLLLFALRIRLMLLWNRLPVTADATKPRKIAADALF